MTNTEAFWEFARGLTFGLGIVGVFFIFVYVIGNKPGDGDWEKFKVVDKYKSCDVVRYLPDRAAEYRYFLDCQK
jgi:hypothetical protein